MWTWCELDEDKLRLVEEVEQELPAEYVLAFREGEPGRDRPAQVRMSPAPLDEGQVARLRDLEREVGCVAVAYAED